MKNKRKATRHLFVPANGISKARGGNVVFNFIGAPPMGLVAEEYFEAAKLLLSSWKARGHNDLAAYPIVYLYRHALELYIKSLLILGNELLHDPNLRVNDDLFKNHRLSHWLDHLDPFFKVAGCEGFQAWGRNRERFHDVVREIDSTDPREQTFRYPLKKDGTASSEEHFAFSLAEMSKTLDPIFEGLSAVWYSLRERCLNEAERMRQQQELAYEN